MLDFLSMVKTPSLISINTNIFLNYFNRITNWFKLRNYAVLYSEKLVLRRILCLNVE